KSLLDKYREEAESFGKFSTLFLGLVRPDGGWEVYDGPIRVGDSHGQVIMEFSDPRRYQEFIGEAVEPWSYLKFPYYRPRNYPEGIYRVGPLARLNLCDHMGTPLADEELREFRHRGREAGTSA